MATVMATATAMATMAMATVAAQGLMLLETKSSWHTLESNLGLLFETLSLLGNSLELSQSVFVGNFRIECY